MLSSPAYYWWHLDCGFEPGRKHSWPDGCSRSRFVDWQRIDKTDAAGGKERCARFATQCTSGDGCHRRLPRRKLCERQAVRPVVLSAPMFDRPGGEPISNLWEGA